MNVIILSFRADDDDDCTAFEAVVDTLDPIYAIIDDDDEPDVPRFPGCTILDTSASSIPGKSEFFIDYGVDVGTPPTARDTEASFRTFLQATYGITLQRFAPFKEESPGPPARCC